MSITVLSWAAFLIIFYFGYSLAGPSLSILSMLPMVVTAWFWGTGPAVTAGVAFLPVVLAIFEVSGGFAAGEATLGGALFGSIALVATGWLTGLLRSFVARLAAEASQRELAMFELADARERLQNLSDGLPVGVYRMTPDGRIIEGNARLAEILGFPDRESMLQSGSTILRDVGVEPDAEGPWHETFIRAHNGRTVWVRDRTNTVLGVDGEVLYLDGVLEDVTDRRVVEEALRSSNERFQAAFREAPIGMGLASPDGQVVQANNALASMLGRTTRELAGIRWSEMVHPDDSELAAQAFGSLAIEGRASAQVELRVVHARGEAIWALLTVAPVRNRFGELTYLLAHLVDISDRKRAEQAMEELLRTKDEFIASVSHELRTPLTVVHGLAHELNGSLDDFPREELEELTRMIAEQSSEVAGLVEDLLVSARADIGSLSVIPKRFDLCTEVRRVLTSLPGRKLITVDERLPESFVTADPVRVRQIVRNLLTNAIRYGGKNVEVAALTAAGVTRLTVIDDGDGVPPDRREIIFEPYETLQSVPGTTQAMGLGLTVSRRLARLMGGDLTYRYEGGRSVFELSVPSASAPVQDRVPA